MIHQKDMAKIWQRAHKNVEHHLLKGKCELKS